MNWLLLNSTDYYSPVHWTLTEIGHRVLPLESPDRTPWNEASGLYRGPVQPDAVCIDHNTHKIRFMYAGFYRGYGLPVVYISRGRADTPHDLTRVARVLGMFVVSSVDDLGGFVATGHPYLDMRPVGRDLARERYLVPDPVKRQRPV